MKSLMAYRFPGNVRELENILERCIILAEGKTIHTEDLPSHVVKNMKEVYPINPLSQVVADAEKEHILKVLRWTKGHKTRAAEVLNISRKNLWEKMNALGIKS
jgi:DNA-binding NtrC family response regulator